MNSKTKTTPKAKADLRPTPTKLDQLFALLSRPEGASLDEMTAATGWQTHSVRGAMAGALRKRGHDVTSEKSEGTRRYRVSAKA